METFGSYLKMLLWAKNIRATDVAKHIDMSSSIMTMYFKGIHTPDDKVFKKILEYMKPSITPEEEIRLLDLFVEARAGIDMGTMRKISDDPLEQRIISEIQGISQEQKEKLYELLLKIKTNKIKDIDKLL